jgi:hypothetical protein
VARHGFDSSGQARSGGFWHWKLKAVPSHRTPKRAAVGNFFFIWLCFWSRVVYQRQEIFLVMDRMRLKKIHGLFLASALVINFSAFAADIPQSPGETPVPAAPSPEATSNAESNATANAEAKARSEEILRSYLQIQEQLHSAMLAIEQNRNQATTPRGAMWRRSRRD